MFRNPIAVTPSAYGYPLLIKQLLLTPLATAPDQEIVYRDRFRYRYRDFRNRIGRLAAALTGLGVEPGMTVAVMDWDSHRYLESYFAIPMMGATMFTVNVRLSPQQIAYTLNDSEAEVVLVHDGARPLVRCGDVDCENPQRHAVERKPTIGIGKDASSQFARVRVGEHVDRGVRHGLSVSRCAPGSDRTRDPVSRGASRAVLFYGKSSGDHR
jgi:hypothetical protein